MSQRRCTLKISTKDCESFHNVIDEIQTWDYSPYPPPTPSALKIIQKLFVAYVKLDPSDDVAKPVSAGVVGIVYCPLGGFQSKEAYIQTVLVRSDCRRRGIAKELLNYAIHTLTQDADVLRIRLHTMVDSPATREYLHRMRGCADSQKSATPPHSLASASPATSGATDNNLSQPADAGSTWRSEMLAVMTATQELYASLGFTCRKNVYAYYKDLADGKELVLEKNGVRKRPRQS